MFSERDKGRLMSAGYNTFSERDKGRLVSGIEDV